MNRLDIWWEGEGEKRLGADGGMACMLCARENGCEIFDENSICISWGGTNSKLKF
jgi:hypothetical protein